MTRMYTHITEEETEAGEESNSLKSLAGTGRIQTQASFAEPTFPREHCYLRLLGPSRVFIRLTGGVAGIGGD